jgi:hypothetical protein
MRRVRAIQAGERAIIRLQASVALLWVGVERTLAIATEKIALVTIAEQREDAPKLLGDERGVALFPFPVGMARCAQRTLQAPPPVLPLKEVHRCCAPLASKEEPHAT